MYKLGWFGYFLGCYKKCLKFSGRASRTEYWSFQLFKWMTYILVVVFRLETNAFMVYATCFSLPYIVKILIKRIKILISKNYGTLTVSENEN